MQEKKKLIIQASIELFAERGFHVTSVQQIVDRSNVAKGSFYNYFSSKDELIRSIYDYYYAEIESKMLEAAGKSDSAHDSLEKQLDVFLKFILENKPLIKMLMNEQVPLSKDMESFLVEMKQQNYEWVRSNLQAMYGQAIEPYLLDMAVMFDGMLHSYSNWIIADEDSINIEYLPKFLVGRIELLAQNMITKELEPTIKHVPEFLQEEELLLGRMRQKTLSNITRDQEKTLETIRILEIELQKEEPQAIIISSLLQSLNIHYELKKDLETLQKKLEAKGWAL
ncbi:TetR/AcrR family transcriptional regulator [Halalkalibacillus halophilus]|uniref:TetR/AcrR family transcriptional regulator n=1 Tax=Halalkalibacillus halophilus TaxID=392827 RepID=UPI00041CD9D0|nr:TetR/AcrR family transcriptional regulator [Halalkalibacillus halophilus]